MTKTVVELWEEKVKEHKSLRFAPADMAILQLAEEVRTLNESIRLIDRRLEFMTDVVRMMAGRL